MQTLSEPIPIPIGARSHIGWKREHNEDSFAVVDREALHGLLDCLLLVADGMGGMGGGDVASRITAHTVPEVLVQLLSAEKHRSLQTLLVEALQAANREVYTRRSERLEQRSMGTTCVCALIHKNTLVVGHVGDSRAYLFRKGKLSLLTADHSAVWEEMQAGRMTREEAAQNPYRHVITRAIGIAPDVEVDTSLHHLEPGDTILLCTDGLTSEVPEREIAHLLALHPNPQEACTQLLETALHHGGSDNVTVLVAHYGSLPYPVTRFSDQAHNLALDEDTPTTSKLPWAQSTSQVTTKPSDHSKTPWLWIMAALILLVLSVAEAAWIYLLKTQKLSPRQSNPIIAPSPPQPPVFRPLAYAPKAVKLSDLPLRDDILAITPQGNLLVATLSGKLILLTPQGQPLHPLPVNAQLPPSSNAPTGASKSHPLETTAKAHFFLTLDAEGNRYQIRPDIKCIEKYTPEGTRVAANLGKGSLSTPTSIAVAPSGTIYVLDNHRLKCIQAYPVTLPTQISTK